MLGALRRPQVLPITGSSPGRTPKSTADVTVSPVQFIEQRRRFRYGCAMLMPYKGRLPDIDSSAYVSPSAQVIGDVVIGAQSSVWFNVVIRGDVHEIRIGARTNIQDNSTVHVTRGLWGTFVGDDVSVAHGVILHGCRIGNCCLIGMGAIVMDGVEVEDECLIAAGSLVTPGKKIPRGHLVMGNPAKVVRELRPEDFAQLRLTAEHYIEYAATYRQQGS
jgi:carbonic anhydrase/acetyltransferase-like protein (isoleucine patch superfamily)